MDKWIHPTLYWKCDYLSMLGLKLNHVSKRGPCLVTELLKTSSYCRGAVIETRETFQTKATENMTAGAGFTDRNW